jgi:hypothetical protein
MNMLQNDTAIGEKKEAATPTGGWILVLNGSRQRNMPQRAGEESLAQECAICQSGGLFL